MRSDYDARNLGDDEDDYYDALEGEMAPESKAVGGVVAKGALPITAFTPAQFMPAMMEQARASMPSAAKAQFDTPQQMDPPLPNVGPATWTPPGLVPEGTVGPMPPVIRRHRRRHRGMGNMICIPAPREGFELTMNFDSPHSLMGIEDLDELEGPFDFLAGVPILGNIVSGASNMAAGKPWGGDGSAPAQSGGTPGAALLSSLGLPTPPMPGGGIGGLLGQAVGQGMGAGPAGNPLAAIMGAGLGGVSPGTGMLPGHLGQLAQGLFGMPGFPSRADALAHIGPEAYVPAATHVERAGRAVVNRLLGATMPELQAIREALRQRRAQVEATGEHRAIVSDNEFKRLVLEYIRGIVRPNQGGMSVTLSRSGSGVAGARAGAGSSNKY